MHWAAALLGGFVASLLLLPVATVIAGAAVAALTMNDARVPWWGWLILLPLSAIWIATALLLLVAPALHVGWPAGIGTLAALVLAWRVTRPTN